MTGVPSQCAYVATLADRAILDLLDGLDVVRIVAALRSAHHGEFQLFRLLGGSHEAADSDRVDSEGLLAEDVLLRLDRGFEVHRPISRRRGEHYDVDVGGQHFLIRIEAGEVMIGFDLEAVGELRCVLMIAQIPQRDLELVFE